MSTKRKFSKLDNYALLASAEEIQIPITTHVRLEILRIGKEYAVRIPNGPFVCDAKEKPQASPGLLRTLEKALALVAEIKAYYEGDLPEENVKAWLKGMLTEDCPRGVGLCPDDAQADRDFAQAVIKRDAKIGLGLLRKVDTFVREAFPTRFVHELLKAAEAGPQRKPRRSRRFAPIGRNAKRSR